MHLLSICVGSSCHLRGSYDVIHEFQRLVLEYSLTDQIELKACFCLGECQNGVSVLWDGQLFTSMNKENVAAFFREHCINLE